MTPTPAGQGKTPLYWRILRLRNIRPNGWQRAMLVEGVIAASVTLVLADVASAWTLLALPVASAVVVKAHDVLTGLLRRAPVEEPADDVYAVDSRQDAGVTQTTTAPPPRGQRRRADAWWV